MIGETATFRLLGSDIMVRCQHDACLQDIRDYFGSLEVTPDVSPDYVLSIEWERADRRLFRARSDFFEGTPLTGVCIESGDYSGPWMSTYPPLPPYSVAPLRGRFVALHGAAVTFSSGETLLLLGDRDAGKTQSALTLINQHCGSLLTDESIFLHTRTLLVEPFPQPLGLLRVAGDRSSKEPHASVRVVASIERSARLASHVLFLERRAGPPSIEGVSSPVALRGLLRHQRDVAASVSEVFRSLVLLARALPAMVVAYDAIDDLRSILGALVRNGLRPEAVRSS